MKTILPGIETPGTKGDLFVDPTDMSLRFYADDRLGGFKTPGFTRNSPPVPGPGTLKTSSGDVGFYGEVVNTDLITPQVLCETLGVTNGSLVGADSPWLKFKYKDNTLYTTKKGIRTGISWAQLYAKGLIYGIDGPGPYPYPSGTSVNQKVLLSLQGHTFLVRCFKGADVDPVSFNDTSAYQAPSGSLNSEWHLLMNGLTNGTLGSYSAADLGITNATHTWCQESNGTLRMLRGVNNTTDLYMRSVGDTSTYRGFRPVLELVE